MCLHIYIRIFISNSFNGGWINMNSNFLLTFFAAFFSIAGVCGLIVIGENITSNNYTLETLIVLFASVLAISLGIALSLSTGEKE